MPTARVTVLGRSIPPLSAMQSTVVISAVAFVIRAMVVIGQSFTISPGSDAKDYQRLAVSLAHGHGWGVSQFAPHGGPTALRAPLYPLMVASIYKVFGVHITLARLAGALLGAVAVGLLMAATWMLWGKACALVAGAVAAVFPPMIIASTGLMTEALAIPLELTAVACALNFRRTRNWRWAALCGAAIGLAILARPNVGILVVALALLVLVRPVSWKGAQAAATVVGVAVLVLTPWLVRDRLTFHRWIAVTTQSGYVVAGTYNHTSASAAGDTAPWIPFPYDPTDNAIWKSHPRANEAQISDLLQSAAQHFAAHHLRYDVDVAYQNTRRVFDFVPLSATRFDITFTFGLPAGWGDADAVGALVILPLALVALFLPLGRRTPLAYWAGPVLLWLTTVVLQGSPRFRAPIDPFLVQMTSVTVVTAWTALRPKRHSATV